MFDSKLHMDGHSWNPNNPNDYENEDPTMSTYIFSFKTYS